MRNRMNPSLICEYDPTYAKRISILGQARGIFSSLRFLVYQSFADSGFAIATVDSAGKYHFDMLSSSPVSLLNFVDAMNTVNAYKLYGNLEKITKKMIVSSSAMICLIQSNGRKTKLLTR